jgi:hypothetical protein
LNVYNILGERVRELVNATQEKGDYKVNFGLIDLPAGIFSYRLETVNKSGVSSKTRLMVSENNN